MIRYTAITAAALVCLATAGAASAQDANKGKSVFNQCKACHALDRAVVGPPLKAVVGRKAGSVEGYSYSPLMKAAGDAGLVWSEAELVNYLKNPTDYLKQYVASKGKTASGSSKMVFMLANEDQRKNVVAYLAQQK
jgi:cytochrome c